MPDLAYTPIFEVVVKNNPLGGTLISWGLKRDFCDPGPYTFEIYWCETPNGTRTLVDTPVLINTYFAIDTEERLWALDIESYYVVVLRTPQGTYESYPAHANAYWNKKDWLVARDICRKEFLMCRKFVGWQGWLLKRKIWGTPCSRCKDFDTNEPSDGHCLVCYGTGKDGGYWPRFPTFVYDMQGGPTQFKQLDDNTSLSENVVMPQMRVLGYPHLATNDVFVHEGSGRRFFLRPVNIAAEIKGIPIIYVCELRLAPYTDIIYSFPYQPVPPKPPEPPEPPTPESEPTYEQPAPPAPIKIQWATGEWQLGLDLDHVLYRTSAGYPMADALDSFTWVQVGGSQPTVTFAESGDGYLVSGDDAVNGAYMPLGTSAGLPVFELTPPA